MRSKAALQAQGKREWSTSYLGPLFHKKSLEDFYEKKKRKTVCPGKEKTPVGFKKLIGVFLSIVLHKSIPTFL